MPEFEYFPTQITKTRLVRPTDDTVILEQLLMDFTVKNPQNPQSRSLRVNQCPLGCSAIKPVIGWTVNLDCEVASHPEVMCSIVSLPSLLHLHVINGCHLLCPSECIEQKYIQFRNGHCCSLSINKTVEYCSL